jgi:hypothetical protein
MMNAALEEIADDVEENPDTREEACGLASYMNRLETGILAAVWHHILHRFHENSQVLQSADQKILTPPLRSMNPLLNLSVRCGKDLKNLRQKRRGKREEAHVTISWKTLNVCVTDCELPQTPADKFRTGTFLVIIDSLDAELRKRLGAYTGIAERFGFLRELKGLPVDQVNAKKLQKSYPTDLEASLSDELVQFSGFLNTEFAKKSLDGDYTFSCPCKFFSPSYD